MWCQRKICVALIALLLPMSVQAQETETDTGALHIELNGVQDVGGACRLTFLAQNKTGSDIEKAVFETVVFDTTGTVVKLSLFDFQSLPSQRPRVRQFDVRSMNCENLGQALINGTSSCLIDGTQSDLCETSLKLDSRIDVELLG